MIAHVLAKELNVPAYIYDGITVNLHHNGRIEDCVNDEGRSLPSVPAVCPCTT